MFVAIIAIALVLTIAGVGILYERHARKRSKFNTSCIPDDILKMLEEHWCDDCDCNVRDCIEFGKCKGGEEREKSV